ncbi:Uncharacterized protein FKW44_018115, partial [Caligus rogercresseyi]
DDIDDSIQEEAASNVPPFADSLEDVIRKVRKIVKTFKKSPVKNDFLAKCCLAEGLKETKLTLDIKIRWNSIVTMIDSVLRARKAVTLALTEFSLTHLLLSEAEIKLLKGVCDCLETVAAGSTGLGSRDMDLARGDRIMEFILTRLSKDTTQFGASMHQAISQRLEQRRLPQISGLLRYLSGDDLEESSLIYPPRKELIKTAQELYIKLFWEANAEVKVENPEPPSQTDEPPSKKSRAEELKDFLNAKEKPSTNYLSSVNGINGQIKREFSSFDATGTLPPTLSKVFHALKTIPPTSVEAERAFSAAGLFLTKLRSCLDDRSLDTLCMLRHFFLHNKK